MVHIVLVLVCTQYALVSCLQSALFPVVLQTVQNYLNTTNAQMAALVSLYDLVQVVASFPCASISVRIGCLRTVAIGCGLSLVGAAFFAASRSYVTLALAQILMGFGASTVTVLTPHIMTLIAESPHRASALLSWSYASASLGVVIGYVVAGVAGPDQWRTLFLINGVALAPVALSLWTQAEPSRPVEEKVKEMSQLDGDGVADSSMPPVNDTPIAVHNDDVVHVLETTDFDHAWVSITQVLANRVVLLTVLAQSSIGFGLAALIAFIPKYISETLGESKSNTSMLMATTVPATALGVLVSGYLAQKHSLAAHQLSQFLVVCCAGSFLLSVMFLTTNVFIFTCFLIADMALVFGSMVPSVMIFPQTLPHELVPFANALSNTSIRLLGSVTGPLVLGFLLDVLSSRGPSAVQWCYTGVSLFSMGSALAFAVFALRSYRSV